MGFIKSIHNSVAGQYGDQFREVIKSNIESPNVLIAKVTTSNGVITDQSRLFVEPGECAIFVDNGAIKDIITEPGMYFMDTSSPTLFQTNIFKGIGQSFLESMKRIAYEGSTTTEQAVYFVSLTEKVGLAFGLEKPIIYKDPEWGPIEIHAEGEFAIRVTNPMNLLTNVAGTVNEYSTERIAEVIVPFVQSGIATEIANLGLSFDSITTKQDEIGSKVIEETKEKLESLGLEITKLVVTSIDVPEEIKNSMRERTGIKMKATSVDDDEADIYTKLNKAEAMKDLANNPSNAGTTIMGMNMGNNFAGMLNDDDKK